MIRRLVVAAALALATAFTATPASAAPSVSTDVDDFVFDSVEVDYFLTTNDEGRARLLVREEWVAVFPETDQNRGIVRAIPNRDGWKDLGVLVYEVTDADGEQVEWRYGDDEDGVDVIEIDDDTFKHGAHSYVIWYSMRDVIRSFDDGDEFFPDVNGDHWAQPIGSVTARLHVDPALVPALDGRTACDPGTDLPCAISTTTGELEWPQDYIAVPDSGTETVITVEAGETPPETTVSFSVGFAAGTFAQPPVPPLVTIAPWLSLAPVLVMLATVLALLGIRAADRRARPRPHLVQYTPPRGISLATSAIVAGAEDRLIPAGVVDLALRERIDIASEADGSSRSYSLTRTEGGGDRAADRLLTALFGGKTTSFALSDVSAPRAKRISEYRDHVRAAAESGGWVAGRRSSPTAIPVTGLILATLMLVALLVFTAMGYLDWWWLVASLLATIAAAVPVFLIRVSPVRLTATGHELAGYLEGLREYIQLAEADRIRMLQSPDGARAVGAIEPDEAAHSAADDAVVRLHLYERLLPYAVLFRLEKQWARVLEGLGDDIPDAPDVTTHIGVYTALSMGNLSSSISSSTSSWAGAGDGSSGGSGFTGGGFSGGGFGGGGGGGR